MAELRKAIVWMLIDLSIVFNIHFIHYQGQPIVDLFPLVYLLVMLSVLFTLYKNTTENTSGLAAIPVWLAIYLIVKLLLFPAQNWMSVNAIPLTLGELTLIASSVWLANRLTRAVNQYEEVVRKVFIPKGSSRIIPLNSAAEEIKTEFLRSQRNNRNLSVMVFQVASHPIKFNLDRALKNFQQSMFKHFLSSSVAQILSAQSRRTDLILEQTDQKGFVMLCPETNVQGSELLAKRIQALAMDSLGVQLRCGYAAFPDQALTFDELLHQATQNLTAPETVERLSIRQETGIVEIPENR